MAESNEVQVTEQTSETVDVASLSIDQENALLESLKEQSVKEEIDERSRFIYDEEEKVEEGVTVYGDEPIPEFKSDVPKETPPATPAEPPPQTQETPWDTRYNSLVPKLGEMGRELGELRSQQAQYLKFQQLLNERPELAQVIFGDRVVNQAAGVAQPQPVDTEVDWMNPESVNSHIQKSVQQGIRQFVAQTQQQTAAQRQQQFLNTWNANVNAEVQRMEIEGVPRETINQAIANFNKTVMVDGKMVNAAWKLHNFDALIKEAERRGAEQAVQSLKAKSDTPRRVSTVSSGRPESGTSYSSMSIQELHAIAMRTDPSSPEYDKIVKAMGKFA